VLFPPTYVIILSSNGAGIDFEREAWQSYSALHPLQHRDVSREGLSFNRATQYNRLEYYIGRRHTLARQLKFFSDTDCPQTIALRIDKNDPRHTSDEVKMASRWITDLQNHYLSVVFGRTSGEDVVVVGRIKPFLRRRRSTFADQRAVPIVLQYYAMRSVTRLIYHSCSFKTRCLFTVRTSLSKADASVCEY